MCVCLFFVGHLKLQVTASRLSDVVWLEFWFFQVFLTRFVLKCYFSRLCVHVLQSTGPLRPLLVGVDILTVHSVVDMDGRTSEQS